MSLERVNFIEIVSNFSKSLLERFVCSKLFFDLNQGSVGTDTIVTSLFVIMNIPEESSSYGSAGILA